VAAFAARPRNQQLILLIYLERPHPQRKFRPMSNGEKIKKIKSNIKNHTSGANVNCSAWVGYCELGRILIVALKLEGSRPSKIQLCIPGGSPRPRDEDRITPHANWGSSKFCDQGIPLSPRCTHCGSLQFSIDRWLMNIESSPMDVAANCCCCPGRAAGHARRPASGIKVQPERKK